MSSSPIWRLAPGQRLVHRCHDGECVLFNDLSGDTHLLDESVVNLLQVLGETPQSTAALAGCDGDTPVSPDTLEAFDELLADLAALYLVEAAC